MDKIDPICWMQWTIPKHNHWFCSEHCVKTYEKQEWISEVVSSSEKKRDNKRIAYLLIAIIVIGWILSWKFDVMGEFMWWFFVVVSLLKLLDLKGFVTAYEKYDLIAMRYSIWWWIYPFIELAIWIGFLLSFYIQIIVVITLILMIIGTIWVAKKLMKNEKFQCACLWTKLNVPLTNLTLVEDLLMGIMSLMILIW